MGVSFSAVVSEPDVVCLLAVLQGFHKVAVAFSGGVDSSLVACAARYALGDRAVAVTVKTELLLDEDWERAEQHASEVGIRWVSLPASVLSDSGVRMNPADRCYHCKKRIIGTIERWANTDGSVSIVDGSNASDLDSWRPGAKALREMGVRSPLAECGIRKARVRDLLVRIGFSGAARPAGSCLATSIVSGTELTPGRLAAVRAGQASLKNLGFRSARVRLVETEAGRIAVLESSEDEISSMAACRREVVRRLREAGFDKVALSLTPYISGGFDAKGGERHD